MSKLSSLAALAALTAVAAAVLIAMAQPQGSEATVAFATARECLDVAIAATDDSNESVICARTSDGAWQRSN